MPSRDICPTETFLEAPITVSLPFFIICDVHGLPKSLHTSRKSFPHSVVPPVLNVDVSSIILFFPIAIVHQQSAFES